MYTSSLVVLALVSTAFANVFITQPTASTTFTAGQEASINWQDDGAAPSLADFGPAKVSIYVGNAQQQTSIQTIVEEVDVSEVSSIKFTPDATAGPNSKEYFIRIESLALKDAKQPQFPALAFSAKFTLAGMTGTFTPDAQKQIDGQTTAPLGGSTPQTSARPQTAGSTAASTTKSASATGSATRSGASASPSNGASPLSSTRVWVGVLAGALAGVMLF